MKKTILSMLLMLFTASCNGWSPGPFNPPTPFLPPTNTPSIFTATPVVIAPSPTSTSQVATAQLPTFTSIPFITATTAPTLLPSDIPLSTQTSVPTGPGVAVEILGCNTSVDVTHGLGEVTNAFVVVRNTGGVELTNLSLTLHALDEGQDHPDKTLEVPSLLTGYQVTLKLTVDSTYRENTPIQVELSADGGIFQRVGAEACKDIGLFAPNPDDLTTPVPSNP